MSSMFSGNFKLCLMKMKSLNLDTSGIKGHNANDFPKIPPPKYLSEKKICDLASDVEIVDDIINNKDKFLYFTDSIEFLKNNTGQELARKMRQDWIIGNKKELKSTIIQIKDILQDNVTMRLAHTQNLISKKRGK